MIRPLENQRSRNEMTNAKAPVVCYYRTEFMVNNHQIKCIIFSFAISKMRPLLPGTPG